MPGFAVLSSALGTVCADNGHCELHRRQVVALGNCVAFGAQEPVNPDTK